MIICLIEQHVSNAYGNEEDAIILNVCVLPFPPYSGLIITDPALTVKLETVIWDRANGCFYCQVEDKEVEFGVTPYDAAKEILTPQGWKKACLEEDLNKARCELFTQARDELKSTIITTQQAMRGPRIQR